MASLEDELQDLKLKNNDLAQKVQHWKMLASQREDEKLDLMKEINELRLKLSRIRSNGSVQASNFDAALQSAVQKALAHLVRASGEIASTMDLSKAYMRDREELDNASPRWSSIGSTPATARKDKVHRVPPLMIGGQSIQPVVALTMLDTSNALSAARNSNPNRNVTERALPMHMLQDVYIPLTRIDVDQQSQNIETENANNADDSAELLELDDNDERVMDEPQVMDEDEDLDSNRILDAVSEDSEPENDEETPPRISVSTDNPLEGPSWMLDADNTQGSASKPRSNLEPDSTTELEDFRATPPSPAADKTEETTQLESMRARASREFTPTVRRRKRTASPPPPATPRRAALYSPRPAPASRMSNSGRVLKVLVAKMRLDGEGSGGAGVGEGGEGEASPPKRAATAAALSSAHAPSPNGATVAGVIVSETSRDEEESLASGEPSPRHRQRHRHWPAHDNTDNIHDWTDNMDEHRINTNRRTNSRERNERANSKERNKQTNDDYMEEHRINKHRRTNSRERKERTSGRERSKHTKREHAMEIQRSESRERNERTNRERNERTSSRDRNKQKHREHTVEVQTGRERNVDRQRADSAERSERQANSAERTDYSQKRSRSRDPSDERQDVRADSRASNDSNRQEETSAASVFRERSGSCDSDSGSGGERGGRTRRTRRVVTYKEKPLNRKLRR